MPTLHDIALTHLRARAAVADRATSQVLRVWQRMDVDNLDRSWSELGPEMTRVVAAAQVAAAGTANRYVAAVAGPGPQIVPEAFAGVTLDGRELQPALFGAVTSTKQAVRAGRPFREAFHFGAVFLAVVANTAVLDLGRQADITAGVAAGRTVYVRVLQPGACPRCAVLAGRTSARTAFLRHPRCRYTAMPLKDGKVPDGFFSSASDYFDSLSLREQDRIFTKAGAEAIRYGADPAKVVNARRGMYQSGALRLTSESTTARGEYGRRSSAPRLMPEQIARMADGDPLLWVELLRRYGYIV